MVAVIYVIVTVGAQMLVPDPLIVANGEVWPAVAGRRALGTAGGWLAIAALLFATSSAINATLFSPARLVPDLSIVQERPARLGHARGGLPATATSVLTLIAAGLEMAPGVTQVLAFASVTVLVVFALVNYVHARSTDVRLERWLGRLVGSACALTTGVLLARLAAADRAVLVLVLPRFASVGALRAMFVHRRRLTQSID